MYITYQGTAAAEGVPAVFCDCEHCRYARAAGGKEIRMRSGALIDGKLKIDFGPDAYATNQLHFTVKNGYEFNHALTKQLEEWDGTVLESAFSRNQEDGTTDYDLTVRRRKEISYSEMKEFIAKHEEIISATNSSAKK